MHCGSIPKLIPRVRLIARCTGELQALRRLQDMASILQPISYTHQLGYVQPLCNCHTDSSVTPEMGGFRQVEELH